MVNTIDISALVCEVVASILQVDDVTPEVNFFVIGGNSVSALAVTVRLQELLGHDIPPELLFDCDRLGQYARAIGDLARPTNIGNGTSASLTTDQ